MYCCQASTSHQRCQKIWKHGHSGNGLSEYLSFPVNLYLKPLFVYLFFINSVILFM